MSTRHPVLAATYPAGRDPAPCLAAAVAARLVVWSRMAKASGSFAKVCESISAQTNLSKQYAGKTIVVIEGRSNRLGIQFVQPDHAVPQHRIPGNRIVSRQRRNPLPVQVRRCKAGSALAIVPFRRIVVPPAQVLARCGQIRQLPQRHQHTVIAHAHQDVQRVLPLIFMQRAVQGHIAINQTGPGGAGSTPGAPSSPNPRRG